MRNYLIDEANEQQPQVLQVNSKNVRLYFDQTTEEREGMDDEKVTVHVGKYVELPIEWGTDAMTLAKKAVLREIEEYDTSESVNEFSYGGVSMWLDKATRAGLLLRIQAEQAAGEKNTTLWLGTQSFELEIDKALQLLYAIEVYASKCFDRTSAHKAAVEALDSVEAILAYDYTVDYPEKLQF